MMHDVFMSAALQYTTAEKGAALWKEIEEAYKKSNRHYHTLTHLEHVLDELTPHKHFFSHWHTLVFAIAYHDVIYNPLKSNNEEKSAELAVKRLTGIHAPEMERTQCHKLILATKKHESSDNETNLFTDADLAILGTDTERYTRYTEQVRQEYAMFPDFLYNPGRKKVLQHFLLTPRIYKTDEFFGRYEIQARMNLQTELDVLNG